MARNGLVNLLQRAVNVAGRQRVRGNRLDRLIMRRPSPATIWLLACRNRADHGMAAQRRQMTGQLGRVEIVQIVLGLGL
jgi:hypothetical protein